MAKLNILVAHRGEARPFFVRYGLREQAIGRTSGHVGDRVRLMRTGQGRAKAVKRVDELLAFDDNGEGVNKDDIWLNFGLAGSAEFAPGNLVVVPGSERRLAIASGLPITGCVSVAAPTSAYPACGVVDMELQGIADCLDSVGQRWMSLKLVSDGPDQPLESLNNRGMIAMIDSRAAEIGLFSDMLIADL